MVDKVLVYPGADEVELTLVSRMINVMHGKCPKVYVKYAVEKARDIVPLYEGCHSQKHSNIIFCQRDVSRRKVMSRQILFLQ